MLSGKNISMFQKEGPSVNEISDLQRLYSIPYEEVYLDLEFNQFGITSSLKYENFGNFIELENTFRPNLFVRNHLWKCFTGQIESTKPI